MTDPLTERDLLVFPSGSRWCTVVACILLLSCGAAEASYSANFFCTVGNERMNLDHSEYELPVRQHALLSFVSDLGSTGLCFGKRKETDLLLSSGSFYLSKQ
jgi:hypothetical protein